MKKAFLVHLHISFLGGAKLLPCEIRNVPAAVKGADVGMSPYKEISIQFVGKSKVEGQ